MEDLELNNECVVYENIEQKREDILWKYRFLVRLITEHRRDHENAPDGKKGAKRNADSVHNRHRRKIQKTE
jgi:hypothetical protein